MAGYLIAKECSICKKQFSNKSPLRCVPMRGWFCSNECRKQGKHFIVPRKKRGACQDCSAAIHEDAKRCVPCHQRMLTDNAMRPCPLCCRSSVRKARFLHCSLKCRERMKQHEDNRKARCVCGVATGLKGAMTSEEFVKLCCMIAEKQGYIAPAIGGT